MFIGLGLSPVTALAQAPGSQGLVPCGSFSDNPCQLVDLFNLVITITNFLIGMGGIVAVVVIIYAGWSLVLAAGNVEAVTVAKKLLVNAFIGFFFVMIAFAGANFLIFGARGFIVGEPTQGGTPVGIFVCPIDYLLGYAECGNSGGGGGNTTNNTPANTPTNNTNTPTNTPNLPFQIPPGRGIGETAMSLEVIPKERDSCPIGQTAWVENFFLIKTAFAQTPPSDCGSVADGYLAGPRHDTFPDDVIIQQDLNIQLGSPRNKTCSSVSRAGCGMISMIHAIKFMQKKGYVYAGSWTNAWHNEGNLNPISRITDPTWWPRIYQNNTGYFTCANNGAVYHSAPSDIMKDGQILRNVTAYQSTASGGPALLEQVKLALERNGVAIALVKGPPFNTGNAGNHFILIYRQYYAQSDNNKLWFAVADSNKYAQIGQVRYDVLQNHLTGVTVIYPTSSTP